MADNQVRIEVNYDVPPEAVEAAAKAGVDIKPPRAMAAICNQPWAITESALQTIVEIATRVHEAPEALQKREGTSLAGARRAVVRGNTAVLPILGPIFPRATLFTEISGAASLETLAKDFAAAEDDPGVRQIMLDIDSPGGQVTGVAEFADMVANSSKPVTAFVSGEAQSAAYWIASQASEVVLSPTALVGSIGAVLSVKPQSKEGVFTFVSSQSPLKQASPDSDAGQAEYSAIADELAQVFVEAVASGRDVSTETVLADFGQGGSRVGAKAVALGMADRVASAESVIAGFSREAQEGTVTMSEEGKTTVTLEHIASEHPDIAEALRAEGAAAECERIQSVFAQSMPGHEDLINTLAFDGKTTGPEAAVQVLNAERTASANKLDDVEKDGAEIEVPAAAAEDGKPSADAPIEERCQARWDADADVRAEFGKFETYLAFEQANEGGQVKMLKNRKED